MGKKSNATKTDAHQKFEKARNSVRVDENPNCAVPLLGKNQKILGGVKTFHESEFKIPGKIVGREGGPR